MLVSTWVLRVQVARRALYEALGQGEEEVKQRLKMLPAEDGIVVGDETRLRQIITNLARSVRLPPNSPPSFTPPRSNPCVSGTDSRALTVMRASSPPRAAS